MIALTRNELTSCHPGWIVLPDNDRQCRGGPNYQIIANDCPTAISLSIRFSPERRQMIACSQQIMSAAVQHPAMTSRGHYDAPYEVGITLLIFPAGLAILICT